MIVHYFAHMQFPYIENHLDFLVDSHLVHVTVIAYLVAHRAAHVWDLDGVVERIHLVERHPALQPLFG